MSDDNAMCDAIFRTLKYRPGFPRKPFASFDEARRWFADFVRWYNGEHLHRRRRGRCRHGRKYRARESW